MKSEDLFGTESRSAFESSGTLEPGCNVESDTTAFESSGTLEPVCTLETITPELAQDWLGSNTHNRNLRAALSEAYARDITDDNWPVTGATISFDVEDKLLDGQHRLTAIVIAGKPIKSFVVRNLPLEARPVTDTGVSRTAADALRLENFNHHKQLPPVIRNLLLIKHEVANTRRRVTNSEIIAMVCKHSSLVNSISYCQSSPIVSASILSAVHYAAILSDHAEKADEFATILIEGLCTEKNDPAFRWRELLAKMRSPRPVNLKLQLLGTVSAWHHFRCGNEIKKFQIPSKLYTDTFDLNKI